MFSVQKLMKCDGCSSAYCGNCFGLSADEIKYMQLEKRNLHCTEFKTLRLLKCMVQDKDKIIKMMEGNMSTLKAAMKSERDTVISRPTYSDILAANTEAKFKKNINNLPCIILAPNNEKQS
ncbi:hypothetical protein HHI36_022314, partial [Cryptolaemus montrouzieri]